jgi:Tol biopolymer transport system component/DNA-binding winged helix-turn-helix (wHTH) protein
MGRQCTISRLNSSETPSLSPGAFLLAIEYGSQGDPVIETKCSSARFSVFGVDLESHELRKHGVKIKLAEQPFQALALLLEHAGEVVTREAFREALWPHESWGEHDQRLNRIINKIREVLSDSAETPRFIETIPRIGYRFLVSVDRLGIDTPEDTPVIDKSADVPLSPVAIPVDPATVFPLRSPRPINGGLGRRPWLMFGGALITCVLAAGLSNQISFRFREPLKALQPVPVTTYLGSELYPSFSPDGSQVAFAWDGEISGASHLYVAPASGGGPRQITNDPASDSSPSWSPDGQQLAFLRRSGPGRAQLSTIHADGSGLQKLREIPIGSYIQSIAWTLDRKWLIVSRKWGETGVPALFRISASTGEETQLTFPSPGQFAGDISPAVTSDGTRLAFTRSTSPSWRDVFVAPMSGDALLKGDPVRLTDSRSDIGSLAWAPDGKVIVFSAASTVSAPHHLFRVDATPGIYHEVAGLGIEGDQPTMAGNPVKLAFVRTNIEQSSTWRLDRDAAEPNKSRMLSSTRRDFTTDLSPDGAQIVFSSIRSGETEVWMSRTDGSNLRRLTSIGGSEPRWSPDGKRIAFVSNKLGQHDIYLLNPETLTTQRLTSDTSTHLKPTWSRDGRFIYFCSDRTGRPQIWKVPSEGGDPVQITRKGGIYAVETFDGKSIYYTAPGIPAKIWVTSSNGGEETEVLDKALGHASIALGRDGLYYITGQGAGNTQLNFLRFADNSIRVLAALDHPVHAFLSSSSDGRSVLFTQIDRQDRDVMQVDPFR